MPGDNRHEPVAARERARCGEEAGPAAEREAAARVGRIAAAVGDGALDRGKLVGGGAVELDRPAQCPRSEPPVPGAVRDHDPPEPVGGISREADPAPERVVLRHAVEDQQGAAAGVAAEPAQRQRLAGGVGRARIRAAEALQPGDVAQEILEPAAGGGQDARAVDPGDVGGGALRLEPATGDDNGGGFDRKRAHPIRIRSTFSPGEAAGA